MKWYGLFKVNTVTCDLMAWCWCAPEDLIVTTRKMRFDEYCIESEAKWPGGIYVYVDEEELE